MSFEDMGKKADAGVNAAKAELNEGKAVLNGLDSKERKWLKYLAYVIVAFAMIVGLSMCVSSCNSKKATINTVGVDTPQAQLLPVQQVQQPVYVQNHDPMSGVLTGMVIGSMMSNGQRYDGHNGYGHSGYNGPPKTIINKTVINNTTVVNKNVTSSPNPAVPSVSKPVVPVAATVPTNVTRPAPINLSKPSAPIQRSSYFGSSRSSGSSSRSSSRSSSGRRR